MISLSIYKHLKWNRRISGRLWSCRYNQLNIGKSSWRCSWWIYDWTQGINRFAEAAFTSLFILQFITPGGGRQRHQSYRYVVGIFAIFRESSAQHETLPRPDDGSRLHHCRHGSSNLSSYAWRCKISQYFCRSNAW